MFNFAGTLSVDPDLNMFKTVGGARQCELRRSAVQAAQLLSRSGRQASQASQAARPSASAAARPFACEAPQVVTNARTPAGRHEDGQPISTTTT